MVIDLINENISDSNERNINYTCKLYISNVNLYERIVLILIVEIISVLIEQTELNPEFGQSKYRFLQGITVFLNKKKKFSKHGTYLLIHKHE